MSESEMSTPVTRGELHAALETWAGAIIAQVTSSLTTSLAATMESLISASELRMRTAAATSEQRILAELGRHIKASEESMRMYVSVVDDQYKDLPGRVTRLEKKVFAPKRRRASKG